MWNKREEELYELFATNSNGLTSKEVSERQKEKGKNFFPKAKRKSLIEIFLSQFKNSIIVILLVAIFFSLIIGEMANAIFISIVVAVNSIIGTFQEHNAEKSAEKLQDMIKVRVSVLRNGEKVLIDSEEIVVGDIVFLESGNKVPADIRLTSSKNLLIDESILTGESEGVEKTNKVIDNDNNALYHKNVAYAGTLILSGRATGVVTNIGINTELGKIANRVIDMDEELSPLVIRINKFSKQISTLFIIMVLMLSGILYLKGYVIREIFFSVIALTVSAIPEGLSTAMTIILSISANRMVKKNVIVKKLSAVESLGSCSVIASDKTGTLTVNEQTAKMIKFPFGDEVSITGEGYNDEGQLIYDTENEALSKRVKLLVKLGILNNEAKLDKVDNVWKIQGDSIDVAFLALGKKEQNVEGKINDVEIISRMPYESDKRFSAVYFREDNDNYISIKGSCEKVLMFCNKTVTAKGVAKIDKEKIMKQNEELAKLGYRVIALAYGKKSQMIIDEPDERDIKGLIFVGLVGFIDPVRKDALTAVQKCKTAGIKIYMITGDHKLTAYHIAKELKIVKTIDEVITGEELDKAYIDGEQAFDECVKNIRVCARVSPLQKLHIVESLKRQGEFVAVTGDGVNDAPALKSANIGVAMGSGTDLAKETSDMIITDDKFSSIVEGVSEGRIAYNNIRSVIYMLLSTGFAEVILYVLSIILSFPFPLIAIQFLWLNLITNGIESNAMAFEKSSSNVMNEKQKGTKEQIFNKLFISETVLSATIISSLAFVLYYVLYKITKLDIELIRTYVLVFLVFAEDIHVFNCRSESLSAFKIPIRNNIFVVFTILLSIFIQTIIIYIPKIRDFFGLQYIPFSHIVELFMLTLPIIFGMELFKATAKNKIKLL